ncbi:uncharacterized protein LOC113669546 [Paramuricea clavata]|uniref:Uncharacterized protein LOC113669546 n=1 Tax=Paramuricea clavata TaxID=317549 RepID=A0A6S7GWN6_PARCT|nr:uncharacterized protein LOC113669546 [Paramuricea clavata]
MKLLFITTILLFLNGWQLQTEAKSNCRRPWTQRPPTVQYLRKRYDLLIKFQVSPTGSKDPTGYPSKGNCRWTYVNDYDANRIPSTLAKAECSNCPPDCTARGYWHMVLERRCDKKTWEHVWVKTQVKLPVAYVYKASSK